ncbi:hypothetical protein HZC33_02055 [Candidatus Wolfebacteria bacterium]|nr:hypothetical protein [Candidatus Wolfebacteria bacterium]
MEQNINPNIESVNPSNKKSPVVFIVIGIIVILVGLGIWYWQIQKSEIIAPSTNVSAIPEAAQPTQMIVKEDSVSAANQELNNINVGDLNTEFQTIDTDLNSL